MVIKAFDLILMKDTDEFRMQNYNSYELKLLLTTSIISVGSL